MPSRSTGRIDRGCSRVSHIPYLFPGVTAIVTVPQLDSAIPALGIQQPWAELIVRGIKRMEIRSQNTRVRGEIYVYASRQASRLPAAAAAAERYNLDLDRLPRGVLVGRVQLVNSSPALARHACAACLPTGLLVDRFAWQLEAPEAFAAPVDVRFLPYGIWFYPFRRKQAETR
jgi:hypothetical protein